LFIGIDLGTSSVKAVLLDRKGDVRASASTALTLSHPWPRWSEQDPAAWYPLFGKLYPQLQPLFTGAGVGADSVQ